MKVGIIGSGGREHSICLTLSKSKKVDEIYCFPGNAGTSLIANNIDLELNNFQKFFNKNIFCYTKFTIKYFFYCFV